MKGRVVVSSAALAAGLSLLLPAAAFAEYSGSSLGTSSAQFMKLGAGARAEGMAEAHVAAVQDTSALYWNPAALTRVGHSLLLMHAPYIDKSYYDYAAYSHPFGGGVLGVGAQYFTAGSLDNTDASGNAIGTFRPYGLTAALGYAREISGVSVGVSGKFIREQIVNSGTGYAADVGLFKEFADRRLALGAAVANIGRGVEVGAERPHLPLTGRLGLAWRFSEGWVAAADGIFMRDNDPLGAFGLEYRVPAELPLFLRTGYRTGVADEAGELHGVTFGVGIGFGDFGVDYALVPYGGLGWTHRISLSWRLGSAPVKEIAKCEPPPAPQPAPAPVQAGRSFKPAGPELLCSPLTAAPVFEGSFEGDRDIKVKSVESKPGVLRISFTKAGAHRVFCLDNPLRVAVDVLGALSPEVYHYRVVDDPCVMQFRSDQFKAQPLPIARLVLDLKGPVLYSDWWEDNDLVVSWRDPLSDKCSGGGEGWKDAKAAPAAAAQAALNHVSVSTEGVRLDLTTPVEFQAMWVDNPPGRLVIDLMVTLDSSTLQGTFPAGSRVIALQSNQYQAKPIPITRVTVDVKKKIRYRSRWEGNSLVFSWIEEP
ncbi:MAG: PorV/PorQ family protein [Elusimicrobia bacterium]|nr:PorV/PorQ family protein [Elusimicrobiota bacterium]